MGEEAEAERERERLEVSCAVVAPLPPPRALGVFVQFVLVACEFIPTTINCCVLNPLIVHFCLATLFVTPPCHNQRIRTRQSWSIPWLQQTTQAHAKPSRSPHGPLDTARAFPLSQSLVAS
jgi:hypothetical protein